MAALITRIEDEVLARLRPALTREGQPHPAIELLPWPGRPEDFKMTHPVGALLVMYRSGKFPQGTGLVEWTAEFELAFLVRNLRTHQARAGSPDVGTGAYDLLEAARVALSGFELAFAAGPAYITSESYTGHREGVWGYSARLSVPMVSVLPVPEVAGPFAPVATEPAPALADVEYQHPADFFPPLE
jgi:Gp37 protein